MTATPQARDQGHEDPTIKTARPNASLTEILARLIRGEAAECWTFAPHGETTTDAWGSAQWIRVREPDGRENYCRVADEPHK